MYDVFEINLNDLSSYKDDYEVFDEEKQKWVSIPSSCYMQTGGFPNIETADKEITAITISRRGEKVVFGLKPYKPKEDNITYLLCKDEYELLEKFIHVWQSGRFLPDVLTGWNIEFFDIPYIVNRIKNVLGNEQAKKLSPWGILEERKIEIHGRENTTYTPAGINVLDYLQLYKKFSFSNEESYKLDNIAEVVLGEKKVDYKAQGYASLDDLYQRNPEMFFDYNVQDVALIDRFEEKLGFIELVMAFAYDAKVNYADTMATVKPWDIIVHNYLLDRCIVIPQFKKKSNDEALMGGYVKEVKPGLYRWVVSFDLTSLYPHLIIHYNISPETKIGREQNWPQLKSLIDGYAVVEDDGYSSAANGVKFSKDRQGFAPALMERMFNDRAEYKKKMLESKKKLETLSENDLNRKQYINDVARYHNLQLAKKIQLNSFYGALSNQYFRWFDFDMAEAITSSGQLTIQWAERYINTYMNKLLKTDGKDYVVASDTDSVVGSTIITVNGIKTTISDYYDSIKDNFIRKDDYNNDYVKKVTSSDYTPSINSEGVLEKNNKITYVMKHKVKKKLYKIKLNGKEIIVTEDHSVIVKDKKTGKIKSIKPSKLQSEKHFLINIK